MHPVSTETNLKAGRPLKLNPEQIEEFRRMMPVLTSVELAALFRLSEPTARRYKERLSVPDAEGKGNKEVA